MGKNNRVRRARKAKERRRRTARGGGFDESASSSHGGMGCRCGRCHTGSGEAYDPPPDLGVAEGIQLAVRALARDDVDDAEKVVDALATPGVFGRRQVDQVVQGVLEALLRRLWETGWQPADLGELARRRLKAGEQALLIDAIAAEARQYSPATIDPRWSDQLAALGARVWWSDAHWMLSAWTERHQASRRTALWAVVTVLASLSDLPQVERILPLPGTTVSRIATRARPVDEKVLARIRALLAKAEATDFPEEAESLSSKAQELMTKFSLDRALLDAATDADRDLVTARRIWLDRPYVNAKALLVSAVARANHCRAILDGRLEFLSVVGELTDLDLVEILATSLLLQANRAMLAQGSQRGSRGNATRSYRQSFLVSYATRIRERLTEAATAGQAEVDDARLLPVLAAKETRTDERFAELYPHTTPLSVNASNVAGWYAGRTAADLATLEGHPVLDTS